MALSGKINGRVTQKSDRYSFYLEWSATQNITNNYSDVTITTYWDTTMYEYGFDTEAKRSASITVDNETKSISKRFNVCSVDGVSNTNSNSWYYQTPYKIQTVTFRVYHNDDGTKSITISAKANGHAAEFGPSSSSVSSGDCTVSNNTITLDTIPRAATITSVGNVTLGDACSVKWTPASSTFKYKIAFKLGSWSYTTSNFITPNTTSAYTYTGYTLPQTSALLDDIPNSTTGIMTATLYTYNSSGTQIGATSSKSFTVTVPSSIKPTVGTITLDPIDITTADGNNRNILVQNKNQVKISVSGNWSAGTGSSIKSYTFSGPGLTTTTTTNTSITTGVIIGSGPQTYKVTITDNRGRTNSTTADITSQAYSAPSFKTFTATRSSDGTTITCNYSLSVSNVTGNSSSVAIYARVVGSTSWGNPHTTTSGSTYNLTNRNKDSAYEIYAVVTDNYGGSSQSSVINVSGTAKILNIKSDGNAVAFGRALSNAENNVLVSKWPIDSDDPARTMHNLTYRGGNASDGTSANWAQQYMNLATVGYDQNVLNGQPTQHGFLLNVTNGSSDVHHLWMGQPNGALYHRGGNNSALNGWRTVVDSYNVGTYAMAQPTVLYSHTTGAYNAITLSDSVANFSYIEIFYSSNGGVEIGGSIKVYNPNNQIINLTASSPGSDGLTIYTSQWYVSAKSLMREQSNITTISSSATSISTASNSIYIYRVLGYK